MEFKKGLFDKVQQGQFELVFQQYDSDRQKTLTYDQFNRYVFSLGMNFLNELYKEEIIASLFDGDKNNRVTFPAFISFLDSSSQHEYTPEEFSKQLTIFDDDRDGSCLYEDIIRVMRDLGGCSDEFIVKFVQRCEHGPKPSPEDQAKTLAEV